jgi:transcriptional regulator with XRE-family HTH domain
MKRHTMGARLQEERKRLGFTQDEMAEIGGVKRNTQFTYEADRSKPDADYLQRLYKKGLDVVYLLSGLRVEAVGGSKKYSGPGEALQAVLSTQENLNLSFNAEQLKTLLEFAYTHHVDEDGIKEFVRSAYVVAGKPLKETKGGTDE